MEKYADLILHVGDSKCGSTAIQNGLYEEQERLRHKGILYFPPNENGHFIYSTLLGLKIRGDNQKAHADAAQNFAQLLNIVATNPPNFLLFSSEAFIGIAPDELISLLSPLISTASSIHIIAYVRCPADHYLSVMQQTIKGSHHIADPNTYKRDIGSNLIRWLEHPRTTSMTVRHFKRDDLVGGSVVTDLGNILKGITGKDPLLHDVTTNTTLSAEQMITLQRYRRKILSDCDGQFNVLSSQLIDFFERLNRSEGIVRTRPMLLPQVALRIQANHIDILRKMHERFPDLDLVRDCSGGANHGDSTHSYINDEIGSMLMAVDNEVASALQFSVPYLQHRVDGGWLQDASERFRQIGISKIGIDAYYDFLEAGGHAALVHRLRSHRISDACRGLIVPGRSVCHTGH